KALDRAPVVTDIGFTDYYARPGDKIFAVMRLKTAIPEEISARSLEGVIEYDATLLDLLTIERVGLTSPADWTLDTAAVRTPGTIDFELNSGTTELHEPGALLRIVFQAKKDLTQTAQSALRLTLLNYVDTRELIADMSDGIIIIDSSCGSPQIIAGNGGPAGTSYVMQNHPNPFGFRTGSGQTDILYDVSTNDAVVTIRVIDATGREVARPIDGRPHAQGIYQLTLDAAQFGSGTYFYEFIVVGQKPMVKKMIVAD
ncbi:MAG TPA: T9SS type A sorting domain-containing protein, partial [Candidatus Kapabacteria bacterium]|nr:T9SS type A sorting domain-containing protein [Candidatus Kapabacteria bacterium]